MEISFEQRGKPQNNGSMLADRNVPEVPEMPLEGESMSQLKAMSQRRQFLKLWYLADLKRALTAAHEGVTSIDEPAGALDSEADSNLADLT